MSAIASASAQSLFGRVSLGYLVVESRKLPQWRQFAREGLGVHVDTAAAGGLVLRIDEHQRRIVVREGAAEDVIAIGWQLHDEAALKLALARLRVARIDVREAGGEEAIERGVERFWAFIGPKRVRYELFTKPLLVDRPLDMRCSGFVTGDMGLGHFAMTTREPEATLRFFQTLFDARVSDTIEDRLNGVTLELTFLRVNGRHHSMALAATRGKRMNPLRTAIHHLNLQAKSLDDVTEAYRRMRDMGLATANCRSTSRRPPASRWSSGGTRSSSTRNRKRAGNPAITAESACGATSPKA
jgi:2,3-dihydroxybiphenyl 1,2-dioxygenase